MSSPSVFWSAASSLTRSARSSSRSETKKWHVVRSSSYVLFSSDDRKALKMQKINVCSQFLPIVSVFFFFFLLCGGTSVDVSKASCRLISDPLWLPMPPISIPWSKQETTEASYVISSQICRKIFWVFMFGWTSPLNPGELKVYGMWCTVHIVDSIRLLFHSLLLPFSRGYFSCKWWQRKQSHIKPSVQTWDLNITNIPVFLF